MFRLILKGTEVKRKWDALLLSGQEGVENYWKIGEKAYKKRQYKVEVTVK